MFRQLRTLLAISLIFPAAASAQICAGDCANDGGVSVDEVVVGVNIALGAVPLSRCNPFDRDGSGSVTVEELIGAINNALAGCPAAPARSIRGVAATGAPIVGRVCAVGSNGEEVGCSSTAVDGSFRIGATNAVGPFLLSAFPTAGGGQRQFSWSPDNDGLANVTPFTTLALLLASNYADLPALYGDWDTGLGRVDPEVLSDAVDAVLNNFANRLTGIVPSDFDPFESLFMANGSGFDGVLDTLRFDFNYGGGTVRLNGSTLAIQFDPGTIPGGNYRLTVTVKASIAPPQTITIDKVPKPSNRQEFCSADQVNNVLTGIGSYKVTSCTFDGNVGQIAATVSVSYPGVPPITIPYTVTYTYTPL